MDCSIFLPLEKIQFLVIVRPFEEILNYDKNYSIGKTLVLAVFDARSWSSLLFLACNSNYRLHLTKLWIKG
jgi:hypothetical protein